MDAADRHAEVTEVREKSNEIFDRTLQIWFSTWAMISVGTAVATGLTVPEWGWYYALMIVCGGMVVGLAGGVGVASGLALKHLDKDVRRTVRIGRKMAGVTTEEGTTTG